MSNADDIREFLTTRRSKVTPERAGLPTFGRQRRVAGLRREEVALLAGISVEYYTRLERGNARGVSENVLDAVCSALQLDEAEHDHLIDLARTANAEHPPRRTSSPQKVRPGIARIVDAMTGIPAAVRNGRLDILYTNDLGRALYSELYPRPARSRTARGSRSSIRGRSCSGRTGSAPPATPSPSCGPRRAATRTTAALSDLVGELSTRSDAFRLLWATHDVKVHRSGVKQLHHPLVGDLTLAYEVLELPADPGLAADDLRGRARVGVGRTARRAGPLDGDARETVASRHHRQHLTLRSMHTPAMDLTFVGWIIVGLIAGLFSGVVAGGRTLRGWMPSLAIGIIAAVIVGWLLTSVAHVDSITSIWVAALLSAVAAVVIRLLINTVTFSDD